ncbi:MAG TPA: carbohydrate porin [Bacteriovoracaceae bacterium]|nr:carbohydrate porin [Bacteriovoracaceae bacterium]
MKISISKGLQGLAVIFAGLVSNPVAHAQSVISFKNLQNINWNNFRKSFEFEAFYTNDTISSSGGEKAGTRNVGALDLYLSSDFKKFSSISGEFMVHFTHIGGPDQSAAIGDTQGTSNIEMPFQVDRVTDLWYQHSWTPKYKSLIGIHDLSTEFNVTDSSLNFLNSAFGTSTELSFSGERGGSIYPITSVGLKNEFQFTDEVKLLAAIYDADPGDESTYRSFHSDIGNHEGYLAITETSYEDDQQKFGLGAWAHSKEVAAYLDETRSGTSAGVYAIMQKKLSNQLTGFVRYGWANPEVSMIQANTVVGAVYRGLLQRKKFEDELGLGVSHAKFSGNHQKEVSDLNSPLAETVYEAYYSFRAHKVLQLRPDLQYIQNPTGSTGADAWALGLRTVIEI